MALYREGSEVTVFVVDRHLPEAGSEINGGENGRVGSADITDALVDFLHGVFVSVGLLVETSEVLNNAQANPSFLRNTEDGRVVGGFHFLNNTELKPFL